MKLVVLFPAVFLVITPLAVVNAAPPEACSQILQNVDNLAANVTRGANAYWTHRKNFIEFKYGPRRKVPDPRQLADREMSQTVPVKTAMPSTLASFHSLLELARQRKCLAPAELRVIREKTTRLARSVNFDRFPQEEDGTGDQRPTRMPK
jgi:hypothetical protein